MNKGKIKFGNIDGLCFYEEIIKEKDGAELYWSFSLVEVVRALIEGTHELDESAKNALIYIISKSKFA